MRSHRNAGRRLAWHVPDRPQLSCHHDHAVPVVALHGAGHEDLLAHAERQHRTCERPLDDNTMALAERSITSGRDDEHRCQRRLLVPGRTDSHQADETDDIDAHRLSLAEHGAYPIEM